MSDGEKDAIIRRIHKSIYIDKSNKIPKGIVTVENNWVSMDREGSVIKDFFRKVTNADLV